MHNSLLSAHGQVRGTIYSIWFCLLDRQFSLPCSRNKLEWRFVLIYLIKMAYSFILPPGLFLLILAYLTWRMWKRDRRAAWIPALSLLLLYLLSASWFSDSLLRPLEHRYPQPDVVSLTGDVIVVLGGGAVPDTPDLDGNGNLLGGAEARLLSCRQTIPNDQPADSVQRRPGFRGQRQRGEYSGSAAAGIRNRPGSHPLGQSISQHDAKCRQFQRSDGCKRALQADLDHFRLSYAKVCAELPPCRLGAAAVPCRLYGAGEKPLYANKLVPSSSSLSACSTAIKEYMGIASLVLNPRS